MRSDGTNRNQNRHLSRERGGFFVELRDWHGGCLRRAGSGSFFPLGWHWALEFELLPGGGNRGFFEKVAIQIESTSRSLGSERGQGARGRERSSDDRLVVKRTRPAILAGRGWLFGCIHGIRSRTRLSRACD